MAVLERMELHSGRKNMGKSVSLTFNGYWREPNISGIPKKRGIYLVYRCLFDKEEKTVDLKQLLYIGQAEDANKRVESHEKWVEWKLYLKSNEQICCSFAEVASDVLTRTEAALIFKHKPPCNETYKKSFPFPFTTVLSTGACALISINFSVDRTGE